MKTLIHIKAAIIIVAFLVSCQSEYSSDELVDFAVIADSLSVETARDVKIVYTDSAVLRAKIFAATMKRFPQAEQAKTEMPDGVKAQFYGPSGQIQSTLTANYAISYDDEERIVMRDSVRVLNSSDEEIKTDEMIWDKEERRIYSDKGVRVRIRDEKILIGEGFDSNESFTKYRIKRLTGTIRLDKAKDNDKTL